MPIPSPLRILLKDQNILEIEDAVNFSRKVFDHYDGATYRNTFLNNLITLNAKSVPTGTDVTNTLTIQSPGTAATPLENTYNTAGGVETNESTTIIDDVASAIDPRPWNKPRTRVEFWSGATGIAIASLAVTLTSGSATAVVPDNALLTPGQAISGTNIPVGTIILDTPFETRTSIKLSNKATGSGDVTTVLTGSNYLGGYFEDEVVGDGIDAMILA